MTYAESIQFLYKLQVFGSKLGLGNTTKLAALAGNPHHNLRFIHVAGTNGKGSTCAMLESIYRQAGLRVGLFTSPHLVLFGERIQVNRQLISENDIVRLVTRVKEFLPSFPQDQHPTFFEVVAVMALIYFAEQKCDLVIWETGLGGRLDATNIVTPLASVITNIQLDHQKWLGDTLEKIAYEKAGIIKENVPAITATDHPGALTVISKIACAKKAPLTIVTKNKTSSSIAGAAKLSLLGDHQRTNAALAEITVRVLQNTIPVADAQIRHGLESASWSGRLQVIKHAGQTILLDGAHNLAGVQALFAAWQKHFAGKTPALVLGILADKDWQAMCHILAPHVSKIYSVPVQSERGLSPQQLADVCHNINSRLQIVPCQSLKEALALSTREEFVVVAGSLYLIGEAMELLHISPTLDSNERGLNEWGGTTSKNK